MEEKEERKKAYLGGFIMAEAGSAMASVGRRWGAGSSEEVAVREQKRDGEKLAGRSGRERGGEVEDDTIRRERVNKWAYALGTWPCGLHFLRPCGNKSLP